MIFVWLVHDMVYYLDCSLKLSQYSVIELLLFDDADITKILSFPNIHSSLIQDLPLSLSDPFPGSLPDTLSDLPLERQ